jgi:serine/threonine protein kinase
VSHSSGSELKRSKYRLLGLIGQGQFGQVFCAVHRPTGRLVALKNLEQERFPTHKFLRELRFLLSLQHANIVTCQALEHTPTGRYLVMDYCEGGTLRNLIREDYRLSPPHAIKIVTDVLSGLAHAHSRGVVHCDIKPENILIQVNQTGWTGRISDFGIARLSQDLKRQESTTGSPAYMAPERFYGQYSEASDLYAVGILLFELLAGYRPFSGTPAELRSAHLNQPLQLAAIPEIYQPVVAKALQKLSGRRFRSAEEMRAALQNITSQPLDQLTNQQIPPFITITAPWRCQFRPADQEILEQSVKVLAISEGPARWAEGSTRNRDHAADSVDPAVDPAADPAADLSMGLPMGLSVYKASATWISHEVKQQPLSHLQSAKSGQPQQEPQITTFYKAHETSASPSGSPADRIEQLLIRPQGCFVVMQRSIGLLPFQTDSEAEANALKFQPISRQPATRYPKHLKVVAEWEQPSLVTIAPQGTWFARLCLDPDPEQTAPNQADANQVATSQITGQTVSPSSISLGKLPDGQNLTVVSPLICLKPQLEFANVLALDAGHLLVVTVSADPDRTKITTLRLFTRRGSRVGMLQLPLGLRQIVSTPIPYRFLGLDQQAGTILLIDLKPYRVKRLWVEISPRFLAATDWGYILADPNGEMLFLDQSGQGIGCLTVPGTITAIAPFQLAPFQQGEQGLLIATWDKSAGNGASNKYGSSGSSGSSSSGSGSGQLYSLDLRTLGLDLIF